MLKYQTYRQVFIIKRIIECKGAMCTRQMIECSVNLEFSKRPVSPTQTASSHYCSSIFSHLDPCAQPKLWKYPGKSARCKWTKIKEELDQFQEHLTIKGPGISYHWRCRRHRKYHLQKTRMSTLDMINFIKKRQNLHLGQVSGKLVGQTSPSAALKIIDEHSKEGVEMNLPINGGMPIIIGGRIGKPMPGNPMPGGGIPDTGGNVCGCRWVGERKGMRDRKPPGHTKAASREKETDRDIDRDIQTFNYMYRTSRRPDTPGRKWVRLQGQQVTKKTRGVFQPFRFEGSLFFLFFAAPSSPRRGTPS